MDQSDDVDERVTNYRGRQTNFGYSSEQYTRIEVVIQHMVLQEHMALPALITAIDKYPQIRDQTQLLEEIFKRRELVEDIISFLLLPRRMSKKYKLSFEKTKKYIKSIASLIQNNSQFFEFYFLMLEENSTLVEEKEHFEHNVYLKRNIINQKLLNLELWFQFLWAKDGSQQEFTTCLGYFSQFFIPFVKQYFNEYSRICDYYEARYQKKDIPVWLILHFHPTLIERILQYTHFQPIFSCLFILIRISIEEQEWIDSRQLLKRLLQSTMVNGATSDAHICHVFKMIKEVKENISKDKDKDGTVFVFLEGIIKSGLVEGSLRRFKVALAQESMDLDTQDSIETNMRFLVEVVHIYYVLLEMGISKTTHTVELLRQEVLLMKEKIKMMVDLVNKFPEISLTSSNGQNLTVTPMFRYYFFTFIKYLLLYSKDFGKDDKQLRLDGSLPLILGLIQGSLSQNRWSSIMHALMQKLLGLIITTTLNGFLQFLIEAFTNKKYVFLNSTRMVNQGDIRSLYNICCRITKSFEGACKSFGISDKYEEWGNFVVHVLQNFQPKPQRSAFLFDKNIVESQDLTSSAQIVDKKPTLAGYIDEADEAADIKTSIKNIDTIQKWKKEKPVKRSGSISFLELRKEESMRNSNSPNSIARNRGSVPLEKVYRSGIRLNAKKMSSQEQHKEKLANPKEMERILSLQKSQSSSSDENQKRMSDVTSNFRLKDVQEKK